MTRSNAHAFWLQGRLKKWAIAAAVVALAAWLFEFSTHLHFAESDDVGSTSAAHVCAYCAAIQVGGVPPSTDVCILPAERGYVEFAAAESVSSYGAPTAYSSRAPPTA